MENRFHELFHELMERHDAGVRNIEHVMADIDAPAMPIVMSPGPLGSASVERAGYRSPEVVSPKAADPMWQWWLESVAEEDRVVDLDRVGIDAQALSSMPVHLAMEYSVVPVRLIGGVLVIAATREGIALARKDLPGRLNHPIRFTLAHPDDIARVIEVCYLPFQAHC
jgi:hypothetical protein